jgi:hypothetical protein
MHGQANALREPIDNTQIVKNDLQPPSYAQEQRLAVDALVTAMSGDISKRIKALHEHLDETEQLVLKAVERARLQLTETVALCVNVSAEIDSSRSVIHSLRDSAEAMSK